MSVYVINHLAQLPPPKDQPIPDDQREELLDRALRFKTQAGAAIMHRSHFDAVIQIGDRPNHLLHLALTVLTLGFWLIPWVIISLAGGKKQYTLAVDEYGTVRQSS